MAITIDTSKPLSEEQIEELRARLPENLVQRYIELSNAPADEPKQDAKAPVKAPAKGKGDDLL